MRMKLSVNEKPVSVSLADGTTLEDLLDSLRERGEIGADRVVVGLEVDLNPWAAEDMDNLQYTRLEDLGEVAIATGDMRECARRILADAVGMVEVVRQAAGEVAQTFLDGAHQEANGDLFRLLDALQHLLGCLGAVQNTLGLSRGPLDPSVGLMERLSGGLEAIQASQERQDWPALAEHIQSQLMPVLADLHAAVASMSGEL